jgi:hypothetical protein
MEQWKKITEKTKYVLVQSMAQGSFMSTLRGFWQAGLVKNTICIELSVL